MAAVISARLIPWEPGVPGIAYELDDGYQGCIDGQFALTIPGLIQCQANQRCHFILLSSGRAKTRPPFGGRPGH